MLHTPSSTFSHLFTFPSILKMRLIGLTLLGWVCICTSGHVCASDESRRVHLDVPLTLNDTILSRHLCESESLPTSVTVEARASLSKLKERVGMSLAHWGVSLTTSTDTMKIMLRFGNTDFGDILDRRIAVITVTHNGSELYSHEAEGFRMSAGDLNTLSVSLTDSTLHIGGGGTRNRHLADISLGHHTFHPTDAHVWSQGHMYLTLFSTEVRPHPSYALATEYTHEQLESRFRSPHDPVEGYWTYFDRANDPVYARPGGQYTLAVVRNDTSYDISGSPATYDILYISGAVTLGENWQPMMLKGSLRSTIFQGHYDMEWIDSTFNRISSDIHASLDSNDALLTLSFPLLKTTLRFSRIPLRE